MTKIIYCLSIALLTVTCSQYSSEVERALKLAGNNRIELERVLEHYSKQPADSMKYKAAVFLIENMVYHHHFDSPELKQYYQIVDSIFKLDEYIDKDHLGMMLQKASSIINSSKLIIRYDIKNLSSSFLINHIDNVFKLSEYPWKKNISDELFFDYLLPYCVNTEPIEDWMGIYQKQLGLNLDSLIMAEASNKTVCNIMMDNKKNLRDTYFYTFSFNLPPSALLNLKAGTCNELTALSIFTMRCLGIPAAWDFTPQWANRSLGHDWAVLFDSTSHLPFSFGDRVVLGNHLVKKTETDKLAKVYRRTYSIQKESLAMQQISESVPVFLRNPYLKDVSSLYFDPVDVTVELTKTILRKKSIVYIAVFDNEVWHPIHWAKIEKGKAKFTQMAKNCAYLAMYYDNSSLHSASYPFIVDGTGNMKLLIPNTKKLISVSLERKYPNKLYDVIKDRMIGGVFQGANKKDFSDAVIIHKIIDFPENKRPVTILIDNHSEFRYVRYVSADLAFVYMAEIEFYDKNGEKLLGDIIGTDGSYNNEGSDKTKVFDGNPLTYFDAPIASGGWVGLDLGKQETITKIKYLSWNSDNHINIGEQYELYYFDKKWISLGQKTGNDSHVLIYDNVPSNVLLLLKNHTKGKEERIFTYENGKQIWW